MLREQLGGLRDEETNPCLKEHILVDKCLIKEDYNQAKCEIFFENYRRCKKFWNRIRVERKNKGIQPNMPGKAEREKIKQETEEKFNRMKTEREQEAQEKFNRMKK